jgi:hypothetical protein
MTDGEKVEYVVIYHVEDGYLVGDRLKERVTRCRDCRFYSEREMRDFNTQKPIGTDCCCERNEHVVDADPDGFCSWAERKHG